MSTNIFLPKGTPYESNSSRDKGFSLMGWLKRALSRLGVSYFDGCCVQGNSVDNAPLRYSVADSEVQYYDGDSWETASGGADAPTLQEVASEGDTTDVFLNLNGGYGVTYLDAGAFYGMNTQGIMVSRDQMIIRTFNFDDAGNTSTILAADGESVLQMPAETGIIATRGWVTTNIILPGIDAVLNGNPPTATLVNKTLNIASTNSSNTRGSTINMTATANSLNKYNTGTSTTGTVQLTDSLAEISRSNATDYTSFRINGVDATIVQTNYNTILFPKVSGSATDTVATREYILTIPEYANDAAADADTALASKRFYKLTGSRAIYQKP